MNVAFVPYIPFSRHDIPFYGNEQDVRHVNIAFIANLMAMCCDHIITLDLHNPITQFLFQEKLDNVCIGGELESLILGSRLYDGLLEHGLVILGPDQGSIDRVQRLAKLLNCPWNVCSKIRNMATGRIEEMRLCIPNVFLMGKNVVLYDDIVGTESTVKHAVSVCQENQALSIHLFCIHALLSKSRCVELRDAGIASISTTNSVESAEHVANTQLVDRTLDIMPLLLARSEVKS